MSEQKDEEVASRKQESFIKETKEMVREKPSELGMKIKFRDASYMNNAFDSHFFFHPNDTS